MNSAGRRGFLPPKAPASVTPCFSWPSSTRFEGSCWGASPPAGEPALASGASSKRGRAVPEAARPYSHPDFPNVTGTGLFRTAGPVTRLEGRKKKPPGEGRRPETPNVAAVWGWGPPLVLGAQEGMDGWKQGWPGVFGCVYAGFAPLFDVWIKGN